jgi:Na+-driven multidrug efflux pump
VVSHSARRKLYTVTYEVVLISVYLKLLFKIALGIKFFFNLTVCLLIILFPAFVASLFTDDPILVETVVRYMPLFFAGMTIFGLQRTCQNTFVALGQAKVSLFIALLRKVILLIPLAVVLPHLMNGVVGVYAAEAIADATAALSCTAIFLCVFPKILQRITPKRDEH